MPVTETRVPRLLPQNIYLLRTNGKEGNKDFADNGSASSPLCSLLETLRTPQPREAGVFLRAS